MWSSNAMFMLRISPFDAVVDNQENFDFLRILYIQPAYWNLQHLLVRWCSKEIRKVASAAVIIYELIVHSKLISSENGCFIKTAKLSSIQSRTEIRTFSIFYRAKYLLISLEFGNVFFSKNKHDVTVVKNAVKMRYVQLLTVFSDSCMRTIFRTPAAFCS